LLGNKNSHPAQKKMEAVSCNCTSKVALKLNAGKYFNTLCRSICCALELLGDFARS